MRKNPYQLIEGIATTAARVMSMISPSALDLNVLPDRLRHFAEPRSTHQHFLNRAGLHDNDGLRCRPPWLLVALHSAPQAPTVRYRPLADLMIGMLNDLCHFPFVLHCCYHLGRA